MSITDWFTVLENLTDGKLRGPFANAQDQGRFHLTGSYRYMLHGLTEWQSRFALFLGAQDSNTVEKRQRTVHQEF